MLACPLVTAPPVTSSSEGPRIKKLQKGIRSTLNHHDFPWLADGVIVDGKPGPMTFKMARLAASMQGLSKAQLKKIGRGVISHRVELILTHQAKRTAAMKRRSRERKATFAKMRHDHKHPPQIEGITTFDGIPCAGWIADCLQKARDSGIWKGKLVSGYRTPEHSQALCEAMCGAPSCPGRCAGTSSNHTCPPDFTCDKYEGAADVSDYVNFGIACQRLGLPLMNALGAADPVHFSRSGR